jgi:alpha-glucosidase
MRPLAMEFPDDAQVADLSDQWCMGSGLMAAPILGEGGKRSVYFPDAMQTFEGTERHARGERIDVSAALDQIPLYVRAGTILPLGPVVMNTAQLPGGPLDIEIYPGKDAAFTLVEDDGVSDAYLNGAVRKTFFKWDEARQVLSWTQEGAYTGKDVFTSLHATVFGTAGKKESATVPLTTTGSLHP